MSVIKGLGASGILIIDGKTLVIKRSMDDSEPGMWEFPKGKTDSGEEPNQTVIREFAEETGLKVKISKSLGLNHWGYKKEGNEHQVTESVYEVELADGERADNIALSADHDQFKWVDADELKTLEPMVEQRRQYLLESLGQ